MVGIPLGSPVAVAPFIPGRAAMHGNVALNLIQIRPVEADFLERTRGGHYPLFQTADRIGLPIHKRCKVLLQS